VWPFGPVRTVPTEAAEPELTVNPPPVVEVDPEAADELVDDEVDDPEEDGLELQAAAVTQTAASTATSVHRLRVDPGSDLSVDLCMCVSDLGWFCSLRIL
jgi:hypothetical protein